MKEKFALFVNAYGIPEYVAAPIPVSSVTI
jgi:hypothetical protein